MGGQEQPAEAPGIDEAFQAALTEHGGEPGEQDLQPEPEAEISPAEPEEPQFTERDTTQAPEEIQKIRKELQADYTRKLQGVAQLRKELAAEAERVNAWKPAMDLYERDPQVRARVDAAFQRAEKAAAQAGADTPSKFEKFLEKYDESSRTVLKELRDLILEETGGAVKGGLEEPTGKIEQLKAEIDQQRQALVERDAAAEQRRFEKAHPSWKEELSPRQQKWFLMELASDPNSDPVEVFEAIRSEIDSSGKERADKKVQQLVDRASNKPIRTQPRVAKSVDTIRDMKDAFEEARKELGVG